MSMKPKQLLGWAAGTVLPFAAAAWLYHDTLDRNARSEAIPVNADISLKNAFCSNSSGEKLIEVDGQHYTFDC